MPTILAIESSCDDTGASVIIDGQVKTNLIASQSIHRLYGGVVPEMASRAHMEHIAPLVHTSLQDAGITAKELDAVAFTEAPGLIGSLLVGSSYAKSLAQALDVPLIGVHHMQAHVLAHWIQDPKPEFPFLCLTVSGGHTQLVIVRAPLEMEVIGSTIDDAAGEAFDKTAKMLGLPYPGGPLIDKHAREGNPLRFSFPSARMEGYNFSFSGIKTSVLYFLQKQSKDNPDFVQENINDICASVQHAIVSSLIEHTAKAAKDHSINHIGIAGGVSANGYLRSALQQRGATEGWHTYIPAFEYCTDNAAMIAMAAHFKYEAGLFSDLSVMPAARAAW